MKFWLTGVIAAVLAVALFAVPGGGVTTAYADVDYCGNSVIDVPDSGPGFDFSDACAAHDDCYSIPGTENHRTACDEEFLTDMLLSCEEQQRLKRLGCITRAYTYYLGVRLGGWAFFPYA